MSKGYSTLVLDLLFGDGGKGKISRYLAYKDDYDIGVRSGTGTNAGASMNINGKNIKTNQFPLAAVGKTISGKDIVACVGSGVSVDPIKALNEINEHKFAEYHVDRLCTVISQKHKDEEATGENFSESHTGSTKSGTGTSKIARVRRDKGILVRDNPELMQQLNAINVSTFLNESYDAGKKIMIAGSQGSLLSLYTSEYYPVVTSANLNTCSLLDNVGLSHKRLDCVIGIIKSAPTMVAQNCGVLPGEISREEVIAKGLIQRGVTTGRVRRVSLTIPFDLLYEPLLISSPDCLALTFCDNVDPGLFTQKLPEMVKLSDLQVFPKTYSNIIELQTRFNIPVKYIEYGKEWNWVSEVVQ